MGQAPSLEAEYVVIGSGAGGSVVAYHLAAQGHDVLLVERGSAVGPRQMSANEMDMIAALYKDGGGQVNTDADMFLLQGECVGGSTVLTNAVCFRMPERIRSSYAAHGFDLPPQALSASYDRVESVLNVHPLEESLHSPAAEKIRTGMRKLDLEPGVFQKSMLRCIGCGYCNVGCRYGRKLDASMTWVPMAQERGARLLTETEVVRIRHRGGRASAAVCRRKPNRSEPDATPVPTETFEIRGRHFVLAGGAINTPELLLRSKILTDRVGRRASFNAGAIMFAEFDEPVDGFLGDQMCVHHITEDYAIEQIHNPPATFAVTMPGWFAEHDQQMQGYRHWTSAGVLVPTTPSARVFLGLGHRLARKWFDAADVRFQMSRDDLAKMRSGFKQLAEIFLAAGARRVLPPLARITEIRSRADIGRLDDAFFKQNEMTGFGSSHPQGGAPLGNDPHRDVVAPNYRVYGFDNLSVADASLFPHSIHVNPMLSIMAIADLAIEHISGTPPATTIDEGPAFAARQSQPASN